MTANRGIAEIVLRSVSGDEWPFGPMFASIVADAPGATRGSLSVTQWVDENGDGVTDWLAESAAAVDSCASHIRGEVATVQRAASGIEEFRGADNDCGETPLQDSNRTPIRISPFCIGRHRLNLENQLSETVLHEARHAWQNNQRAANNLGTDDDGDRNTLKNDDDGDYLNDEVEFPSAASITEADSLPRLDQPHREFRVWLVRQIAATGTAPIA